MENLNYMPQLEFWGASKALYHFGQLLMIAAVADDPDVHLLPDIYHLFRGGSGFDGLKLLDGHVIEMFHVNDYPGNIPRTEQQDKDRVYPGDGVAPVKDIFKTLYDQGGTKYLSVELFNREYWKQDARQVARTALTKTKAIAEGIR
jgi:sugar phosphate isomerase/epimerase